MTKINSSEFQNFIISNIESHPAEIVTIAAQHFNVSRQAVHNRMRLLTNAGVIQMHGVKKNARYGLINHEKCFTFNRSECPPEDIIFSKFVKPALPEDIDDSSRFENHYKKRV